MKFLIVTITAALAGTLCGQGMRMDARYGGPSYMGKPALNVTSSLIAAGGGTAHFSTPKALTAMVGEKTVTGEVGKLTKQYGASRVNKWLAIFDFAVDDAIKIVTAAKVQLPAPSINGATLASTLVKASMDKNGTIYTELLLDKALTHGIHGKVMDDIDAKFSPEDDLDYHRITNQLLYDVGVALKIKHVKLAVLH
jgi:hypothetical protein